MTKEFGKLDNQDGLKELELELALDEEIEELEFKEQEVYIGMIDLDTFLFAVEQANLGQDVTLYLTEDLIVPGNIELTAGILTLLGDVHLVVEGTITVGDGATLIIDDLFFECDVTVLEGSIFFSNGAIILPEIVKPVVLESIIIKIPAWGN